MQARRSINVEVEALLAGLAAGLLGGGFAAVVFGGKSAPIWSDWEWGHWSIGMAAVIAVAVLGTVSAAIGHWRSRRLEGQEWRLELPSWKFTLDAIVVAVVHTALAALATAILLFVVQLAFRRLTIDPVSASIGSAIVTGLASYILYLAVSRLTTVKLSQRMFIFVGAGLLSAMATSTDPIWWRYQISVLGAFGNRPSISFNAVLIVAGVLVTTFALYVDRDIRNLHDARLIRYRWAAPIVAALFIAMGIALAGIGIVPVNVSVFVHNIFAISLSGLFGILLLVSPIVLRGMPWAFLITTVGFLLVLALATWLFYGVGYLPLTNYELIAFGVLFGWISMFVRFLAVLLDVGETDAASPGVARSQTLRPNASQPVVSQQSEAPNADRESVTLSQSAQSAQPAQPAQPDAEGRAAPLPDDVPPRPPLPTPHDTGLRR